MDIFKRFKREKLRQLDTVNYNTDLILKDHSMSIHHSSVIQLSLAFIKESRASLALPWWKVRERGIRIEARQSDEPVRTWYVIPGDTYNLNHRVHLDVELHRPSKDAIIGIDHANFPIKLSCDGKMYEICKAIEGNYLIFKMI